ncbi:MAG: hypothetical protein WAV45_07050 [Propionibacteriaceae bacterium]|jgi:hypothetical protein|nr:hypothetical protein [Micropruina sp.]
MTETALTATAAEGSSLAEPDGDVKGSALRHDWGIQVSLGLLRPRPV